MVDGCWWLEPDDDVYPTRLRALPRPPRLEGRGRWPGEAPAIAIVGARAASHDAMALAHAMAGRAVAAGRVVVSGGALGIDRAAHQGALAAGGQTVVVVGTGLDVAYPSRNAAMFDQIAAGRGAVVSMFPRGVQPRGWHFVARNAVIAALADLVIVVAAAERSGSLATARAARGLGRPVAAVPGTAGTDALVAAGAVALVDASDLDAILAGAAPPPRARRLDRDLAGLCAHVPVAGASAAAIAAAAGLRLGAAIAMLAELAAAGLIAEDGDGYRRVAEVAATVDESA